MVNQPKNEKRIENMEILRLNEQVKYYRYQLKRLRDQLDIILTQR